MIQMVVMGKVLALEHDPGLCLCQPVLQLLVLPWMMLAQSMEEGCCVLNL
jgi:hypothetical protein